MASATLPILGPLTASVLIVLLRRRPAALALLGAMIGLAGALDGLRQAAAGRPFDATFAGLPGFPLRVHADPLAAVLSTMVAVVALLVLVHAVGYMAGESERPRFFAEMSFFAAAMQTLVLAGDWVLFLAAWELIGLASYLLIGFWYERPGVKEAATRAFVTTRGADLGLYLAVFVLITQTRTSEIGPTLDLAGPGAAAAGLLLLVAAAGKAAQVPLQGWLQDAMLGPTPVSAFLHSATLVAAGAILLIRAAPLLPPPVQLLVGVVGGVTALIAGLTALAQHDLKRLLASSTSSQLGFMLLALGAGSSFAALAHLVVQAAVKSSLFLASGIFQHARDSTAFNALRGVGRAERAAFVLFVVAGLALVGVPPLAGFWSKDAIEAAALESPARSLLATLAFIGTALTGAYLARATRLLWLGQAGHHDVRGRPWMLAGLAGLALLAASLGIALRPLARLLGGELPDQTVSIALGVLSEAMGLLAGWFVPAGRLLGPVRPVAARGFRIGDGWLTFAVRPTLWLASRADAVDQALDLGARRIGRAGLGTALASRWFDEAGIDALIMEGARAARDLGARARRLQTGLVFRELVLTAAGVAVAIALLLSVR